MTLIPTLDDEFIELAGIVHKYLTEFEEKHTGIAIHEVEDLIKHEHFKQISAKTNEYFQKKFIPK